MNEAQATTATRLLCECAEAADGKPSRIPECPAKLRKAVNARSGTVMGELMEAMFKDAWGEDVSAEAVWKSHPRGELFHFFGWFETAKLYFGLETPADQVRAFNNAWHITEEVPDSKPYEGLASALKRLADTMFARAQGIGSGWMYREIRMKYGD